VRALRLVLLLCVLPWFTSLALERIPSSFIDIEQDGTGVVWASCFGRANQFFAFDGQNWRTMPIQVASETVALAVVLSRMVDGVVACVWRLNSGDGIMVTRHLGKEYH
jgi:hypothetical protein